MHCNGLMKASHARWPLTSLGKQSATCTNKKHRVILDHYAGRTCTPAGTECYYSQHAHRLVLKSSKVDCSEMVCHCTACKLQPGGCHVLYQFAWLTGVLFNYMHGMHLRHSLLGAPGSSTTIKELTRPTRHPVVAELLVGGRLRPRHQRGWDHALQGSKLRVERRRALCTQHRAWISAASSCVGHNSVTWPGPWGC